MTVRTSAGTVIGISATLAATQDKLGYDALTYIDITNVGDGGDVGVNRSIVTFTDLATGNKIKVGGEVDNGSQPLEMAKEAGDPGQDLLKTHAISGDDLAVSVTYPDATVDYYQGNVTSFQTKIGGANNILMVGCNLEVNSTVIDGT